MSRIFPGIGISSTTFPNLKSHVCNNKFLAEIPINGTFKRSAICTDQYRRILFVVFERGVTCMFNNEELAKLIMGTSACDYGIIIKNNGLNEY